MGEAMRVRRPVACIVAGLALSGAANAQSLHGVVKDAADSRPVAGVIITALDPTHAVLGRVLTNSNGEFTLRVSTPATSVRAQRIGWRVQEIPVHRAAPDSLIEIRIARLPAFLAPVHTVANANCPRRRDEATAFALLEQARDGLLATIVARNARPAKLVLLSFHRELRGDRIRSQSVHLDSSARSTISFGAVRNGPQFVRDGFVQQRGADVNYLAPDAETLLDPDFSAGYCFRLLPLDRARPAQVGLGFSSADRRPNRVDIDGAVWIDTAARALHDIEFRYVRLPVNTGSVKAGGGISFHEMPNGVVLIDRWTILLPRDAADTSWSGSKSMPTITPRVDPVETGGEMVSASWRDGTEWEGSLGTLRMTAMRKGLPASGVRMRLEGTDYTGVTDSTGEVVIRRLLPGPYTVVPVDSVLDAVGVSLPAALKFIAARDTTITATAEVTDIRGYIEETCSSSGVGTRTQRASGKLVLGRVVRADGGSVDGTDIFARRGVASPFFSFRTGSDGTFHICMDDTGDADEIKVSAVRSGRETLVEIHPGPGATPLRIVIPR
jgi:hypothetical protein